MSERTGNNILDLLPGKESSPLLSASQLVSLPQGQIVFQQDGPMPHVYFPTTSVVGIVLVVEEGKQVEGTTVGNEGMAGLPLFLGLDYHPLTAVVRVGGDALKVAAATFLQTAKPGTVLDGLLRRYAMCRLRSANQMGACNALHSVEERMARWLLMAQDRSERNEFLLTHEFLSQLLGVRRQTVSITAGTLQRAGLITYRRGMLRVVDRAGLEAASCDCYQVMKQTYARIFQV